MYNTISPSGRQCLHIYLANTMHIAHTLLSSGYGGPIYAYYKKSSSWKAPPPHIMLSEVTCHGKQNHAVWLNAMDLYAVYGANKSTSSRTCDHTLYCQKCTQCLFERNLLWGINATHVWAGHYGGIMYCSSASIVARRRVCLSFLFWG